MKTGEEVICKVSLEPKALKLIVIPWAIIGAILTYIGTKIETFNVSSYGLFDFDVTQFRLFFWVVYETEVGYRYNTPNLNDHHFDFLALIFGLLSIFIAIVFPLVLILGCLISNQLAPRCSLVLTDKGLTGQIKTLFSTNKLELPIEQISSIFVSNGIFDKLFGGKTLSICSSTGRYKIHWVKNADEFSSHVTTTIDTYKKQVASKSLSDGSKSESHFQDSSIVDKLKSLQALKDEGILSEEEFNAKKAELLSKM